MWSLTFVSFLSWIHKESEQRTSKQKLLVEYYGLLVKSRERKKSIYQCKHNSPYDHDNGFC